MKIKKFIIGLTLMLATTAYVGCRQDANQGTGNQNQQEQPNDQDQQAKDDNEVDAVTTASIVNTNEAFEKAISKDGTWLIATLKDLTFDKELVVDGDFKNGKTDDTTGEEQFQRKIALYTQDENRKVTERFNLTAPSITFNSVNGSLEHGTFNGDVYVSGKNFKLINQTINGNLYFLNQEAMESFSISDKDGNPETTITGVQELRAQ